MVLTEAFAAGTPVIASAIAGYSDVVTDGVDGMLVPPGDPQRLAEELQRVHHEPQLLAAMGAAARHSAKRYAWPRVADQVTTVYERAMAAPQPVGAAARAAHWAGLRPADGNHPIPPQKLPSLDPRARPGRQARPPHRPPRRARRRRRARRLPHLRGAEADRRQRSGRKHRPLRPQLGPRRLRPDVDLDVLPRRVLVLDRARRAAQPPGPPPRRHLGDDDRGADVGDLAGPPRRARQGAGARPAHRPDAGDLPGPARHPGLADPAQPGRAGAARRDHRLDHAALPLGHQAALRLQPRAADPARRRPRRAVRDARRPATAGWRGSARPRTGRWSRCGPA